ncbi:pyridoxal-dependent decarboxylase [Limtongia smithiae]|uniref:pyridoxal-dependent decarboxylase n=1 Tax=Limtongia smithiae TaxID=1125753 RepID=UPI0034CE9432
MTEVEPNAVRTPSMTVDSEVAIADVLYSCLDDAVAMPGISASAATLAAAANLGHTVHGQALISRALRNRVNHVDTDSCAPGGEDPFFVADVGEVYRQHLRWGLLLPRVRPFYAVKCNPDPNVLKLLARLGTGFDCASKKEMDLVLSLGVEPSRIVYAHPCKTASFVRYAAQRDVRLMTFDNAEELHKIKRFFPEAELLLRVITDDSESLCRLSMKYGASLADTPALLKLAQYLDLNVVGCSFHVGSGAAGGRPFVEAAKSARAVFDIAAALGTTMTVLDVGGGFSFDNFENIAAVLRPALDALFPPSVRIIAEPGRYYVASAFTLACHVIARREVPHLGNYMFYLNDGVYGNMNCIMFDHQRPAVRVLTHGQTYMYGLPDNCSGPVTASVWGPTCDGIDCITGECQLPYVLDVGDWVYFDNFGAYTICAASGFNGFNEKCDIVYVCSEENAKKLLAA